MAGLFPILAIGVCVFYFLPTIIAGMRHHRHRMEIGITDFLLGWTGIGWIITLILGLHRQRST